MATPTGSISITQDVNLPALEAHLANPTRSYLHLNGETLEVVNLTHNQALQMITSDTASEQARQQGDLPTGEAFATNTISARCLVSQTAAITNILMRTFNCPEFTPTHPHTSGKSFITDTDLAAKTRILARIDFEDFEKLPDATQISSEKSKPPLNVRIKESLRKFFSKTPKTTTPPARAPGYGSGASGDSGIDVFARTTSIETLRPKRVVPTNEQKLVSFREAVTTLRADIATLDDIKTHLEAANRELTRLEFAINQMNVNLLDHPNTDLDTLFNQPFLSLQQQAATITNLQNEFFTKSRDIHEKKESLNEQQRGVDFTDNTELSSEATTLLRSNLSITDAFGDALTSVNLQNSLQTTIGNLSRTLAEKRQTLSEQLDIIQETLESVKIGDKTRFSWNSQTNSLQIEGRSFLTRDKSFVPIEGSRGIYCKKDSVNTICKLIEAVKPDASYVEGASQVERHLKSKKDAIYQTLMSLAISK